MKISETSKAKYIARAREMYASDDLEIDNQPQVSVADTGVWVAAWVFVHKEELPIGR
jgi:hypothetical protein